MKCKAQMLGGMLLLTSMSGLAAATATAATDEGSLKLQRVVLLMRHGVRPPTKPLPEGVAAQPWPTWPVEYGELTPHGYAAVVRVAQWDHTHWQARGLLADDGCPSANSVAIAASWKSRTQDTARAMAEGLWPGCRIAIDFPASEAADTLFHPPVTLAGDAAVRAVEAVAPPGGMAAELAARAPEFAHLQQVLGAPTPAFCAAYSLPAKCTLAQHPPGIAGDVDRPGVGEPFATASTLSQTFLLEYLEGMPMRDVGWGRLDRDGIAELLELNALKFRYEGTPVIAAQTAGPLVRRMLVALEQGPDLTLLAGHDTNVADLGNLLGLHWQVPGYPQDSVPPGSALGFELLADGEGKQFVRAFYRAQTMEQVREQQVLGSANPPFFSYLPIPGCPADCPLAKFGELARTKNGDVLR